jgi:hypothetical protein
MGIAVNHPQKINVPNIEVQNSGRELNIRRCRSEKKYENLLFFMVTNIYKHLSLLTATIHQTG